MSHLHKNLHTFLLHLHQNSKVYCKILMIFAIQTFRKNFKLIKIYYVFHGMFMFEVSIFNVLLSLMQFSLFSSKIFIESSFLNQSPFLYRWMAITMVMTRLSLMLNWKYQLQLPPVIKPITIGMVSNKISIFGH